MSAGQTTRSQRIRISLEIRNRYPSSPMIFRHDGRQYFPGPNESPYADEVLIGAWDLRWTVQDVELALDRAYVGCKVVAS